MIVCSVLHDCDTLIDIKVMSVQMFPLFDGAAMEKNWECQLNMNSKFQGNQAFVNPYCIFVLQHKTAF